MTTQTATCMHRQTRSGNRQDLFCKKAPGHVGNHMHDAHPGGVKYFRGRGWAYGSQIATLEALGEHGV